MLGTIFQLLAGNIIEDNIEELTKVMKNGGDFEFDTGFIGKQLEKYSKGRFKANLGITTAFKGASSAVGIKKLALYGIGGISKMMFHPVGIASRMILGEMYDRRTDYIDEQASIQSTRRPDISNKYLINEDFRALSSNTVQGMEMVNYTVNQLLNSPNLAGNMIDRVFEKM